jgi:hypothetical protein
VITFADCVLLGLVIDSSDSSDSSSSSTDSSTITTENRVAATAGKGATSGLPTADDSGAVSMTYRQVGRLPRVIAAFIC